MADTTKDRKPWTPSDLEQQAMSLVDIEGWYPWKFEAIHNGVLCTGAVCPIRTRGPYKGRPNYRKADKTTMWTVLVPYAPRSAANG